MPFDKKYDILYGTIKQELLEMGLLCFRDDEIPGNAPFMNKVITEILRSRYVIVILSDYRPNVLYELGIAHTFKEIQNVLLINEHGSHFTDGIHSSASDISHLTYIEYDPQNLMLLTSQIRQFIESNKYIADFYEILNIKGIINLVTEASDFSQYIQSLLGDRTTTVTQVLSGDKIKEKTYENLIFKLEEILRQAVTDKQLDWVDGIIKLYCELLISGSDFCCAEAFCNNFLISFFNRFDKISEEKITVWQTDFCVYLASRKKFLNIILPWIINYFIRSKSARVDLNRYKLESFLLTCNYQEVDDAISNAILSPDCHIREHMADIIGEKKLFKAKDLLVMQLMREDNNYTAASIIEAIGKIGYKEGKHAIMNWLNDHFDEIITTKQYFVIKHAKIALDRLFDGNSDPFKSQFDKKYVKYIEKYYIL